MATISEIKLKRHGWLTAVMLTLGFWLSGSLILDFVIMPSLYATGMMTQAGFATAGYSIFWVFNRIELLCAGLVLTGLLVLKSNQNIQHQESRKIFILSALLLAIAIIYTYILTPQMSALGMELNLFEPATEIPTTMNQMHGGYWILEVLKLICGTTLLGWCYRQQN